MYTGYYYRTFTRFRSSLLTTKVYPPPFEFPTATALIIGIVIVLPSIFIIRYTIWPATSSYHSTHTPDSCNGHVSRIILALLCVQVMLLFPVLVLASSPTDVNGRCETPSPIVLSMFAPGGCILISVAFLFEVIVRLVRHGRIDFSSPFSKHRDLSKSEMPLPLATRTKVTKWALFALLIIVCLYGCSCTLPKFSELQPIELAALIFASSIPVVYIMSTTFLSNLKPTPSPMVPEPTNASLPV